jgi:plastocyanin
MLKRYLLSLSFALLLPFTVTFAEPITLLIQDTDGNALENAVIELTEASEENTISTTSTAIMDQINKQFEPNLLVIKRGQSVAFPNSDNIRHHVYSFSKAKPFELKLYAGRSKPPVKFNNSGVVIVGCNIHDSMVGNIYVAEHRAVISDSNGKVTIDSSSPISQVTLWHPLQTAQPEQRRLITLNELTSKNANSELILTINVAEAEPRDTFGDTYGDQTGY